jgi:Kdo2-lipid IVA lauroyltransferase/acyltransferase
VYDQAYDTATPRRLHRAADGQAFCPDARFALTSILLALVLLIFRLLSRLPLGVLHALGALLGLVTFWSSSSYRREIRQNLRQAGYEDPALAYAAAREAGKSILELPFVWLRPAADVLRLTSTSNWELIDAAQERGKGIIFMTPHLGCFDVTAQHFALHPRHPAPITVLYRPPRKAALAPLVAGIRARPTLLLAPANLSGVKRLVRALRAKEAVGILPDQVPSLGEGVLVEFFGRTAYTMTLPARLEEASGADMLLAFGERLPKGAGWIVRIAAIEGTPHEGLAARTAQINLALESLIRRCPEQYLWGYRRYKLPRGVKAP